MIWGTIFSGGTSRNVQMQRDELAARSGYTARSYLDVLEAELPCVIKIRIGSLCKIRLRFTQPKLLKSGWLRIGFVRSGRRVSLI